MRSFRPIFVLAGLAVSFALILENHSAIASGIQALATVVAGGTGLATLTANAVLVGNGTSPVLLATSPGDNTKALCGSNPPAFGATCGAGVVNGGGITVFSGSALTITANTYYFPIGGGASPSITETNVDTDSPTAATITNFYAQLSVALGMGNTGVFTWRKNASSQSLTCTITGASATTCNDTTHSFAVVAGDLITVQLVTTGTIVVTPNLIMSVQFGTTGSNGTVNTGTINQIAYYAASGTAISGETLIGNGNYYGTLGSLFVAATETTASTSFVDLATVDTVTFVCAATCNVFVQYTAYEFSGTANTTSSNIVLVDGSSQATSQYDLQFNTNTSSPANGADVWIASALSAASHTIKVQHKVSAGTGSWARRQLVITQTP